MTDSSTGGYLAPAVASPPLEDLDLDAEFQKAVVGITALPGAMVRPRWQVVPPKQPEPTVNWCSIGVMAQDADDGPNITHNAAGNGSDTYYRHEDITLECTFYGPLGQRHATLLRDGLGIHQNLEALEAVLIAFVECSEIRTVPELVNQQWIRRYDLTVTFRRQIKRTFSTLSILSVPGQLVFGAGPDSDTSTTPIAVS